MAERDVIYRLKAIYDQSGSQAFAAMAGQHAAAIKTIEDRWKAFDAAVKAAAGSQGDSVGKSYQKQKNHAKEFYDYVQAENRKLVEAIKERERAEELARRTQERAMAQMRSGNAQMREGLLNTAEGITRVARGLTLMGFVSDQNLEKLLKTLAAVQGVSDVVLGSVKAYSALQKAVDGYSLAVSAARAAEAARAGVAAGGAAAGAGAAAGGLGIGALATGGAAAVAAIASVSLVLVELSEIANGTSGDLDSLTSRIGRFLYSIGNGDDLATYIGKPYHDAYENEQNTKRFQRRANTGKQNQTRIDNEAANFSGWESTREASRRRQVNAGFGSSGFGDEGAFFGSAGSQYNAEIERMRGRAAGYAASGDSFNPLDTSALPGAIDSYRKSLDAENEIVRLKKEQYDYQMRMSQDAKSYHTAAINAAQQELDILKQQQDAATGRYQSAEQRFGSMNPMEQSRVLRLSKMAQQANELRAGGRTAEADRITSRMTLGDLSALGSLPLEANTNTLEAEYKRRAEAGGFGALGGAEKRAITEAAPRIERLIAEKTLNVEAIFKVEISDEQIKRAWEAASKATEERIRRVADKLNTLESRLNLNQKNTALSAGGVMKGG